MSFLVAAMRKANSTDATKLAGALRGMKVRSPFGADGSVTIRAEDQTTIGYAIGWGTTIPNEPYVPNVTSGDWKTILEYEAEWKKKMGYA
jgi:branched-chain amino acid transport system substrate-binding protein